MKDRTKTKDQKCPYCTPTDIENPCILATAKTVIDGKEYYACCSNSKKTDPKAKRIEQKPKRLT